MKKCIYCRKDNYLYNITGKQWCSKECEKADYVKPNKSDMPDFFHEIFNPK